MAATPLRTPARAPNAALAAFLTRYDGLRERLPGPHEPRDAAAEVLREMGWPTPKEEPWHYTNLRPVEAQVFRTRARVKVVCQTRVRVRVPPRARAPLRAAA